MKKSILNFEGVKTLNKNEQKMIAGGVDGPLRTGGGIGSSSLELCEGLIGMDEYCCLHPSASACTSI